MSPKRGRPTDSPKTTRLEVRVTKEEIDIIERCAKKLNTTKTDVVIQGIRLVEEKLNMDNEK